MNHLLFLDSLKLPPVLIKIILLAALFISYELGYYRGKKKSKDDPAKK